MLHRADTRLLPIVSKSIIRLYVIMLSHLPSAWHSAVLSNMTQESSLTIGCLMHCKLWPVITGSQWTCVTGWLLPVSRPSVWKCSSTANLLHCVQMPSQHQEAVLRVYLSLCMCVDLIAVPITAYKGIKMHLNGLLLQHIIHFCAHSSYYYISLNVHESDSIFFLIQKNINLY